MALTREFKDLVVANARRDPLFRQALLSEAINVCLEGDLETGKIVLRDLVNATIGFEGLAQQLGIPSKSLHRMLSPRGNPSSANFFAIIGALLRETNSALSVKVGRGRSRLRRPRTRPSTSRPPTDR
jgi:DNA-binding phage protein